jgi:hypothetical protein
MAVDTNLQVLDLLFDDQDGVLSKEVVTRSCVVRGFPELLTSKLRFGDIYHCGTEAEFVRI